MGLSEARDGEVDVLSNSSIVEKIVQRRPSFHPSMDIAIPYDDMSGVGRVCDSCQPKTSQNQPCFRRAVGADGDGAFFRGLQFCSTTLVEVHV
jgi:hypothetical protein